MVDELKIKLTADVEDFKKGMKDARDSLEDTAETGEETETSFKRMAQAMREMSPSFKEATDKWKKSSDRLGASFGKGSKLAKVFKIAGAAAIVGVVAKVVSEIVKAVVEAAKAVWEFAKDTAKAYDPKGFAQSAGAVEKSVKKLKTAVGSFTAPIVNTLQKAISKIIDGITWVVEKVRIAVAYITGILKAVFEPVVNGIKEVVAWVQGGINSIGNFLGIGDIFKKATDQAGDAADKMDEITEATSAGLASFDKLNTLNINGEGDAKEAEKISEAISKADKDGQSLIGGINKWLEKLDLGSKWDNFVTACGNAKDGIVEKITGWWDGVKSWASEFWEEFKKACGGVKTKIVEKMTDWWSGASTWASGVWQKFVEAVSGFKVKLEEKFSEVVSGIPGIFTGIWTTIKDKFMEFVYKPIIYGINAIIRAYNKIPALPDINEISVPGESSDKGSGGSSSGTPSKSNKVDFGSSAVKNPVTAGVDHMVNVVTDYVTDPGDAWENTKKWAGNLGNSIVSGAKRFFGLANGGAVAPNSPMPYILGDNKKEYEVISPVSLMEETVMSAMQKMGVGGSGGSSSSRPIEVSIEVDGRKLARALYDPIETERKRRGMRT